MLNIDEFTKRLESLFEIYELTPSTFADKIGVQRSSISHLLSGRNKPSLDFVLKVQSVFPDIELNWLLHGKGEYEGLNTSHSTTSNKEITFNNSESSKSIENNINNLGQITTDSMTEKRDSKPIDQTSFVSTDDSSGIEIDKIVIFYKNGTFKSFKPD